MQMRLTILQKDKQKWGLVAAVFTVVALISTMAFMVNTAAAASATLVVDDDGKATPHNCNSSNATPHSTITSAVGAASAGDTVKVCPGAYAENVVIDKALSLKGAREGDSVRFREFGHSSESTITGLVTIQAANVKFEGFSLTNPNQGLGIIVKTDANEAVMKRNIVQTVGSATFAGPTVGIYLERGPDNVRVDSNKIGDVQSQTGSAQALLVGDSTSTNPSLDIKIDDNKISDITSVERGAYGVLVNNGASASASAIGYTEAKIRGNSIKNLSGTWAHAIGLEGETPNAVVESNTISNLTDTNPVPVSDAVGVFFEANPFFFTGQVNQNSLDVTGGNTGIAVHPTLAALYPSLSVDGECNWWGGSRGPSSVGTGTGSMVGANVDFRPWLRSSHLEGGCGDRDHHDDDHHYGDWGKHDDSDWHRD